MAKHCYCRFCGRPTDCNGDVCELYECGYGEVSCVDGEHCGEEEIIEEVKPNLFKYKKDGAYYLKWMP